MPLIRWRIGPREMFVGIIYMVLKVSLAMVPFILPTEELSMLLRVLLTHVIEPQMEASKLISKDLAE